MPTKAIKNGFLSNNALKLIAAVLMVCDHVGLLLLPRVAALRCIGRLAFPIFAYLIAEGAKHTKNFSRYFLTMASFAALIQVGYYAFTRSLEMSVMVTFTLSLMIIYALELFKTAVFEKAASRKRIIATALLFLITVLGVAFIGRRVNFDYCFVGCLLPVLPSVLTTPRVETPPAIFARLDAKLPRVLAATVGTLLLTLNSGTRQFYGLLAIPLLLLYSERRGRLKMKYFFYVFYPLHLVILHVISMLIK